MKCTIIIVLALFVISDKTSQGLKFPLQKKILLPKSTSSPNEVVRRKTTYVVLKNRQNSTRKGSPSNDPIIMRKKFSCLCKLPVCICSVSDNPEVWYVKTFLRGDAPRKFAFYSIKHRETALPAVKCGKGDKNKDLIAEKQSSEKGQPLILCSVKKKLQCAKKWRVNSLRKSEDGEEVDPKTDLSFQCECLQFKILPLKDKSGALLKCEQCGPITLNTRVEKANFSNLLLDKKNTLKIRTRFIQFTN